MNTCRTGVHAGVAIIVTRPLGWEGRGVPRYDGAGQEWLLLQRAGAHGAGLWCVPGGWCEHNEHPGRAALRELREEVGDMLIGDLRCVGLTSTQHDEFRDVCVWYRCRWAGGPPPAIQEPGKCTGMQWVDMSTTALPLFQTLADYRNGNRLLV